MFKIAQNTHSPLPSIVTGAEYVYRAMDEVNCWLMSEHIADLTGLPVDAVQQHINTLESARRVVGKKQQCGLAYRVIHRLSVDTPSTIN